MFLLKLKTVGLVPAVGLLIVPAFRAAAADHNSSTGITVRF
ncbi:MAG: hypothetical protein ACREDS_02225 [Limisphaerales bacterium]